MKFIRRGKPEPQGRRRRIFAVMTDSHGGHKRGLLNPDTVLVRVDDKGEAVLWKPDIGEIPLWLWNCAYLPAVSNLADWAGDDEIIVIHAGDITNGNRFAGNIPDTTLEDQRTIAVDNMMPLCRLPQVKRARLVTGTEVHVPECAEARVALRLREKTGKDVKSVNHALLDVDGTIHDTSHHGAHPGTRDWLKGNTARYYLRDRMYRERRRNRRPANIYWRGHYHELIHESIHEMWCDEWSTHHIVIAPCLSGPTHHAIKVTRSLECLVAGIIAAEIVDGEVCEIRPFVAEYELRTMETL